MIEGRLFVSLTGGYSDLQTKDRKQHYYTKATYVHKVNETFLYSNLDRRFVYVPSSQLGSIRIAPQLGLGCKSESKYGFVSYCDSVRWEVWLSYGSVA